jgi:ketosteroid isomerase-like protein
MPSANLDFVRSIYAAWQRGDWTSVEWADPAIELVLADGPDPGSFTGVDEMAEAWRSRASAWEGVRFAPDEFREIDDERVLVFARRGGRGKTSGVDLTKMRTRAAHLFHVRAGKVTKIVVYLNPDRALADLGLST